MARRRVVEQRHTGNDRGAVNREAALGTPSKFWDLARKRFPPEIAALADQARDLLTLRDLRAIEAAELVEIETQIAATENGRARTALRAVAKQARRNLNMIVIAENPTLDPMASRVPIPAGMALDDGQPTAERVARRADRLALVEAEKVALLDRIMAGTEPPSHYLRQLHGYPREELLRLRADAVRARQRLEDEAKAARAELVRQRAAGRVAYPSDLESELADDMAAELRDDFTDTDDDDTDDPFADL